MKRIEFKSIREFVDNISDTFENPLSKHFVSVYGKYAFIKAVLENLISDGYTIANEIDLQDYDVDFYDKEFVLYLTKNGINVEKTWHEKDEYIDGVYYIGGGNISFVHDECNSKLLPEIDSSIILEVGIIKNNKDEVYKSDSAVHYSTDEDGETHGFTASKSDGNSYIGYSFYTTEKLDKDMINDLLKGFGF